MADFIVDEEDLLDENGQPLRRKKTKKKALRPAPGVSSLALQEAQEIFGDVSLLLEERRARGLDMEKYDDEEVDEDEDDHGFQRTRLASKKRLEMEFEPSLLEEKYMTDRDDHIRAVDIPERLQLLYETMGEVSELEDASKEAEWIYERAFGESSMLSHVDFSHIKEVPAAEIVKQISNVLHLLHVQKLEVPFIGMYRKEMCTDLVWEPSSSKPGTDTGGSSQRPDNVEKEPKPELKHYKGLWAVQSWDKKWLILQRRKRILQTTYTKRAESEIQKDFEKEELLDKLLQSLLDANSEQAVDDVDAKFNLYFPPDDVEVEQGQFKRPKRRSLYSICRRAGLGSVNKLFGLSPEQFGENLQATYKRHEVVDASESPEVVAGQYKISEFPDPQSVLRGARHMASVEISSEPSVREHVRLAYLEKAVVTTKPTVEGNSAIDSFHQYAGVKWLREKPVSAFKDVQWLLIQKAEEEKLLEVSIGIPKIFIEEELLEREFEPLYLSDGVSTAAQLWNEQRKIILKDALMHHLFPLFEKETRALLSLRAKQWVMLKCGEELWKLVSVAPPVAVPDSDDHSVDDGAPPVMACCWGPGKPATTFVMLDPAGELVDTLHTGYLTIRPNSFEQEQWKRNDQQRLLRFLRDHQPHVVVVGAVNLACRQLYNEVKEVLLKIGEKYPRDLPEGLENCSELVWCDETIPSLYENSSISVEQLQQQPGIVRRAIALGRYVQNPLAMVSCLCGPEREILSLKLHHLQLFVNRDDLYESLEQVMITITNQVCVDVNLAASHEWLFAPLQFISGLGPRKAVVMKRSLQGAGRVNSRKEMLTALELMKRNVFFNSAGFLRVRGSGQASTGNLVMDPLDDTRIHPESYELAKKMAEDAYCEEMGQNADEIDEETLEMAVEHVRGRPDILSYIIIEAYANVVEERGGGIKLQTLKDIKAELVHGFQDWRCKYKIPNPEEEVFYWLSGETDESLAEGKVVQAKVVKVHDKHVLCMLDSGLMGSIRIDDLSDDKDFDHVNKISVGTILTCRIKAVKKKSYMVYLTCKGKALRNDFWNDGHAKDAFYHEDTAFLHSEEDKAQKKSEDAKRKSFKPRMIVHPNFQNISLAEAEEVLADKDVGEVLIRPSSKGPSHLAMMLKFYDGLYAHVNITESGKDGKDATNFLRLGKTLTIQDESFEDLDEVMARYVEPLVGRWRDMLRYRKFKPGRKEDIDELLRSDRTNNPSRFPYYFSVCHEHPGAFMLSYIRSVNPHHEYVTVTPTGYKFRKQTFDNIDKLVAYFQKHFNEPVPDAPPRRALAAMVLTRSPAPTGGHASGAWDSSGRKTDASTWDTKSGGDGWGMEIKSGGGTWAMDTKSGGGSWGMDTKTGGGSWGIDREGVSMGSRDKERGNGWERGQSNFSADGSGWNQDRRPLTFTSGSLTTGGGWEELQQPGIGGWQPINVGVNKYSGGWEEHPGRPVSLSNSWEELTRNSTAVSSWGDLSTRSLPPGSNAWNHSNTVVPGVNSGWTTLQTRPPGNGKWFLPPL
ncbi:hypothetical protein O6H91_09G112200 [Diphasiastrum complanatum]|nr:hypothetical protein O6H91_09G112200 [Diphasiastrum complanatum]